MSKEGFLLSHESNEEMWESYVITMECKLYENRGSERPCIFLIIVFPAFVAVPDS